ncbi:pachytene checkpoint protein 2 homolog isoform X1 [Sitodiplosis mosellana]|uniref:pachytene checkpoint protein 2 homolog isoform X1 n=1 Tax=Sitodiplosis mosellana TaxID=263140 RepID=UPI002444ADC0|nr:pachytene checkpoint protein 2 homolog isoform X1 [Sitodiplosis mosellana]
MDYISTGDSIEMDCNINAILPTVYVEILRRQSAKTISDEELHRIVFDFLKQQKSHQPLVKCDTESSISELVEEVTISQPILLHDAEFEDVKFFTYTVNNYNAEIETIETADGDNDDIPASQHWILPNREFQGQWEYLHYEDDLKENLLRFSKTIMLFALKNVDINAISCNKLVLLHGPPGTGKTSLCKSLAQKISIHMNDRFRYTHLFEINSHSLFSKWFSESGKLVLKMFTTIKDVAEDPLSLVVILIDEVESIAYARDSVSSHEPSDSIRVVNSLLTQLDQLRRQTNVLVLTTSNLSSSIDIAFVDRADLKQYVGYPTPVAIYHIFKTGIDELIKVKIVTNPNENDDEWNSEGAIHLLDISKKCEGLSGRSLRKLPLLAHAWFVHKNSVDLHTFLNALDDAVDKHLADTLAIEKKT